MGGRSPLSSCGRRSAPPPPPVAGFANPIFYNISIGDLKTPMFQQAPMLPIFDVRCVHRTNNIGQILPLMSLLGVHAVPVVSAVTRSLKLTERSRPVRI